MDWAKERMMSKAQKWFYGLGLAVFLMGTLFGCAINVYEDGDNGDSNETKVILIMVPAPDSDDDGASEPGVTNHITVVVNVENSDESEGENETYDIGTPVLPDPSCAVIGDDTNCDGVDDDCDGVPDDGYLGDNLVCVGPDFCEARGYFVCWNGGVRGFLETDHAFDCLDPDNSGVTDESACYAYPRTDDVFYCDDDCYHPGMLNGVLTCIPNVDEDDDGVSDCYCEILPCLGSVNVTCADLGLYGGDCDDTATGQANHPGVPEYSGDNFDNNCDGVDDDGDGETDEDFVGGSYGCGVPECRAEGHHECVNGNILKVWDYYPEGCSITTTVYLDSDSDGYGSDSESFIVCTDQVMGRATVAGDCNNADATINPLATEKCGNEYDDNCDGQVDEECEATTPESKVVAFLNSNSPGNIGDYFQPFPAQTTLIFDMILRNPADTIELKEADFAIYSSCPGLSGSETSLWYGAPYGIESVSGSTMAVSETEIYKTTHQFGGLYMGPNSYGTFTHSFKMDTTSCRRGDYVLVNVVDIRDADGNSVAERVNGFVLHGRVLTY